MAVRRLLTFYLPNAASLAEGWVTLEGSAVPSPERMAQTGADAALAERGLRQVRRRHGRAADADARPRPEGGQRRAEVRPGEDRMSIDRRAVIGIGVLGASAAGHRRGAFSCATVPTCAAWSADVTTLSGYAGGEKMAFIENPKTVEALKRRGLVLERRSRGLGRAGARSALLGPQAAIPVAELGAAGGARQEEHQGAERPGDLQLADRRSIPGRRSPTAWCKAGLGDQGGALTTTSTSRR